VCNAAEEYSTVDPGIRAFIERVLIERESLCVKNVRFEDACLLPPNPPHRYWFAQVHWGP